MLLLFYLWLAKESKGITQMVVGFLDGTSLDLNKVDVLTITGLGMKV